jgi:lysophospholipase L1-like esterase
VIGAAALVAVGLIAYLVWPRDKPDLVIVGDSVTFLSIPEIESSLGDDYSLDIRAYPGQASTDLVLVVLQELVERDEIGEEVDAMALLVGYNDVLRFRDQPNKVAELVDLSAGAACTVVLTVPAPPTWSDQEDLEGVRSAFVAYNEALTAAVDTHPGLHLVTGWQEAVEASGPGELVDTDGVHPIAAGKTALAEVYTEAIESSC